RAERLHSAIDIVAEDKPRIVAGDLLDDIDALIAEAPVDATLVVLHSSTLVYVPEQTREAFAARMSTLDGYWISQEGLGVAPTLGNEGLRPLATQAVRSRAALTVSVDGSPRAFAGPHGGWIRWLD